MWYRGRFAWEYKGKHTDLNRAYSQLLAYRGGLDNPPLLVVCDFLEYRIYPQWSNISGLPFVFKNEDLLDPKTRRFITWLLESPEKFLELRQTELERREKITLDLANQFAQLADLMNRHFDESGSPIWQPMQIARFLTKLVFALFAEDVGLLPRIEFPPEKVSIKILDFMAHWANRVPDAFVEAMQNLFRAMDGQVSHFWMMPVPYFNGSLFMESSPGANDGLEVLDLTLIPGAVEILRDVTEADWSEVNPTIFGTLFEGALDESKRAQLGAHYTGEDDIRLIVEPVLMQPLYHLWNEIRAEAEHLLQRYFKAETPRAAVEAKERLIALHDQMMNTLENTRVLDPACGSGNFLYVSLRTMKDLEQRVRKLFEPMGFPFRDVVTPRQLYGIEKDEFAAKLAHVVVWIGYLQWRYEDEGVIHVVSPRKTPHPRSLPHPILKDKNRPDEPDRIICADAIMRYDADGKPYEPEWPQVDVIISNPPFLGDKYMRFGRPELGLSGLGTAYASDLRRLYKDRLPSCDLVCYWFEKARSHIESHKALRAGLLATNSIRGGLNRRVLDRIKQTGDIFMAWGDRPWLLKGASVRIAVIGFDDGAQKDYMLDGAPVHHINADLQNTIDATQARRLNENHNISFMADTKGGSFDISQELALIMLESKNISGRKNQDVVRPWVNGLDIVRYPRNMWIVDFGTHMSIDEAQLYEMPFQYVKEHVFPKRQENRRDSYKQKWWIHVEPRPTMRQRLSELKRFIGTVAVAKYRLFVWLSGNVLPDHSLFVFARDDDYFFGVLHSRAHEIWSLRLGTSLEDRPRYTPSTTFETFPFPYPPGAEDITSPAYAAISEAAKQLHEERHAWLNPVNDMIQGPAAEKILAERTLTNLYNALEAYRAGKVNGNGSRSNPATAFVPRLAELHDMLNQAVLSGYGWGDLATKLRTSKGEEDLLRRLLALNLERDRLFNQSYNG